MELNIDKNTIEYKVIQLISTAIKNTIFENKCYLVGGSIRDLILGINKIKDIDIVVELDNGGILFADFICNYFNCYKKDSNPIIFERFGTAKFNIVNYKGVDIECVFTRTEIYNENDRKPIVSFGTLLDDAKRRDLTINTVSMNISNFKIYDLLNGIEDIKNKVIKTPLNPTLTFTDDALRMLRVVRFAYKYNFKIQDDVLEALFLCSSKLQYISKERINDEFMKILSIENSDSVVNAIRLLVDTNMIEYIIPQLKYTLNLKQNKYHDKDVFNHILEVVRNSKADKYLRLAALLHDIGKPFSTQNVNDTVKFKGHDKVGSDMVVNILTDLKFPNENILKIQKAVFNHMRCKTYLDDLSGCNDKIVRKLVVDLGEDLEFCLDLIDADNKSHKPCYNLNNQITLLKDKIKDLKENDKNVVYSNPPIDGFDIMKFLNVQKGCKDVGIIMNYCKDLYLENPQLTKDDFIELINVKFKK